MTKSATNRKWTSSEKYRDNWDRIFRNEDEFKTRRKIHKGNDEDAKQIRRLDRKRRK